MAMREHGDHPGGTGAASRRRVLRFSALGGLVFGAALGGVILLVSPGGEGGAASAASQEPAAAEPAEPAAEVAEPAPARAPAPADAAPEPVVATLRFDVAPASIAEEVALRVDGDEVVGHTYEVTLAESPQSIEVVASARGYRRFETELEVEGDRTIEIRLRKRRPAARGGKGSSGKGSGRKEPSGPGGLIDL